MPLIQVQRYKQVIKVEMEELCVKCNSLEMVL